LNIAEIETRCSVETIAGPDLYPFLATSELNLGKGFQVVQRVHAGESECLAVLQLPKHLEGECNDFRLHPSLLDGALHSAIGMVKKRNPARPWSVLYSVSEVQVFGSLKDAFYAHATWDARQYRMTKPRPHPASSPRPQRQRAGPDEGLRGDAVRTAGRTDRIADAFAGSVWTPAQPHKNVVPESTRIVLLGDRNLDWCASYPNARQSQVESLEESSFDQLLWIAPDSAGDDLIAQQEQGVMAVFGIIKALLHLGYANKKLQWTVTTRGALE
jgi:hypothetical protein